MPYILRIALINLFQSSVYYFFLHIVMMLENEKSYRFFFNTNVYELLLC